MRIIERRRTYLPHIVAIGLLWAIAMTLDYHDQASEAQAQSAAMSAQMAACLRGEWRGRTENGEQIGCMPAETFKNTKG
jgi:hypothetical protein